ncbi:hypothetical protein CoNPh33_CDS0024 [Staphylococcus phage S-CoN_Ph33]|nr:hypothetical protein CoNPh33_CDS0024 [Staphylococcus phage S-CoN_Ph33]
MNVQVVTGLKPHVVVKYLQIESQSQVVVTLVF